MWFIRGLCWEACLFLGERVVEGVLIVDVFCNVALVAYKVHCRLSTWHREAWAFR